MLYEFKNEYMTKKYNESFKRWYGSSISQDKVKIKIKINSGVKEKKTWKLIQEMKYSIKGVSEGEK